MPGADAYPALRARALCDKAWCLWPLGRGAERRTVMDEAEAIARQLGDPRLLSHVLETRAQPAAAAGRLDVAATLADEALHWAKAAGDDWAIAVAAEVRALAAGSADELREHVDRAAALLDEAGNVYILAELALLRRLPGPSPGQRSRRQANSSSARSRSRANSTTPTAGWSSKATTGSPHCSPGMPTPLAKRSARSSDSVASSVVLPLASEGLLGLAAIAAARDDPDRAARLVGAAAAHAYGSQQHEVEARLDAAFLDPARTRHGADAWDAAARDGSALSVRRRDRLRPPRTPHIDPHAGAARRQLR